MTVMKYNVLYNTACVALNDGWVMARDRCGFTRSVGAPHMKRLGMPVGKYEVNSYEGPIYFGVA